MHWQLQQGGESRHNDKNLDFRNFRSLKWNLEKIQYVCINVTNRNLSGMECKWPIEFLKGPIITEAKKYVDRANGLLHLIKKYSFTLIDPHLSKLYPFQGHSTKEKLTLVTVIKCIASKMSFLIFTDDFSKDLEPFVRVTETRNVWFTNMEWLT